MVSADDARAFDRLLSAARQDEVVIVFNDDMPNSALSDIDARGRTDHNRAGDCP